MKYPISDYLANHGGIPISAISLELPHPNFPKRLIDVATLTPSTPGNKPQIMSAFELKLAKLSTRDQSEKQRIFNDLIRLHLVEKHATDKCYFMISGITRFFQYNFLKLPGLTPLFAVPQPINASTSSLINPIAPFFSKWFSFRKGCSRTFKVSTETDLNYFNIYTSFFNSYQNSCGPNFTLQLPTHVTTTCEFISTNSFTPYMAGVWSVH